MGSVTLQSLSDRRYRTDFTSPPSLALIQPAISKSPLVLWDQSHYTTRLHLWHNKHKHHTALQYTTHTAQRPNTAQRGKRLQNTTQRYNTMSSSRQSSRAHSTGSASESCTWQTKLEGPTIPTSRIYLPNSHSPGRSRSHDNASRHMLTLAHRCMPRVPDRLALFPDRLRQKRYAGPRPAPSIGRLTTWKCKGEHEEDEKC